MKMRTALLVLGVVFGLTVGASSAQAAKGVKKKANGNGEHHHHGKVISVDHKAGHFTIAVHHHSKKKKGTTATATPTKVQHIKFNVTNSSKFFVSQNKNKTPSSFSALKVGEHVGVASKNHHADTVVIHKQTKPKKKNNKKPVKVN